MPTVKVSAGILYVVTALLIGFAAFYMMMQTVNGAPFSWWGPVILGAAILLMVAGIHAVESRIQAGWLSLIAAATPLAICTAFHDWPLRCWIFAAILGALAWVIFKIEAAFKRGAFAAFCLSMIMAAAWLFVSVSTIHSAINALGSNAAVLVVLAFYWVLIIAVLTQSGRSILRRSPKH